MRGDDEMKRPNLTRGLTAGMTVLRNIVRRACVYHKNIIRGHRTQVKKLECFEPPSTVRPSSTHLPGGNRRKIDLPIE